VVREAVKSLVAKGCSSPAQGRHARAARGGLELVRPARSSSGDRKLGLTREFLRDLQELRRARRAGGVSAGGRARDGRRHRRDRAAYAGMKQAIEKGGDYVSNDLRFHQGLLRACHNRMVVQMSKALARCCAPASRSHDAARRPGRVAAAAPRRARRGHRTHPAKAERAIIVLIEGANDDIEEVLSSRRRLPQLGHPGATAESRSPSRTVAR
jgi:DNA-binding FadR family transcriptional regulator